MNNKKKSKRKWKIRNPRQASYMIREKKERNNESGIVFYMTKSVAKKKKPTHERILNAQFLPTKTAE